MTDRAEVITSPLTRHYLRLQKADHVGPVCARKCVEHFGSIEAVFDASAAALEQVEGVGRYRAQAIIDARSNAQADEEIERAADIGVRIICWQDDEFPVLLKHMPDPPVCLYLRGKMRPEDGLAMAIVGSRSCSRYGLEQSERFGAVLAQAGFTIVSGMARGADGMAHRGALSVRGRTIAVLGCGLGHVYPQEHAELADEIVQSGALVSELPINTPPDAKNFLPRNRIIAGMSLGVLVTECAKKSGALASARLACEYNREVFALPGQIANPLAMGSNALIRDQKAKLVMCLEDILDELGDAGRILKDANDAASQCNSQSSLQIPLDESEQVVIDALSVEGTPLEHICDQSGLAPASVAASLTRLQIKGLIVQQPGNIFALKDQSQC